MSSLNTVSLHGTINMGGATGTNLYPELEDKPKINNIVLVGNKTTSDLGINEMPASDGAAVGSILTHTENGESWLPPKSQVEANPIGATVGDLSTIGIQGVNYKIPSGGGLNYSTDEQVVGTWIDGSTIYSKTFTFTNREISNNSETNIGNITSGISIKQFINAFLTSSIYGTYSSCACYLDNGNLVVTVDIRAQYDTVTLFYIKEEGD